MQKSAIEEAQMALGCIAVELIAKVMTKGMLQEPAEPGRC